MMEQTQFLKQIYKQVKINELQSEYDANKYQRDRQKNIQHGKNN